MMLIQMPRRLNRFISKIEIKKILQTRLITRQRLDYFLDLRKVEKN